MSLYQASRINTSVPQAVPGFPVYLLGSYAQDVATTRMNISTVALAGTTATVVGTVAEGNIPVVGQLVTLAGAVPSYFNVTNAKILTVSSAASPDVGVYTITFTLANSNIGTTSSPGIAVAPQLEVGDSITLGSLSGPWSSLQCGVQQNVGPNNGRSVRFDVSFPTLPNGNCTVVAQSADLDLDAQYTDLGTVATVTAGVQSGGSAVFADVLQNLVRFQVRNITSPGSGTVVGKVLV